MGVRWFLSVFSWVLICVCAFAQKGFSVCGIPGCNCTVKAASWKTINCSLHYEQKINLVPSTIPQEAFEIYIKGGEEIIFTQKTFNELPALTLIFINGTKKVVMDRKSFNHINSSSLLIQIQNCDELLVKTAAFDNVQGSISTEITDVNYLTIEQSAFSKLYSSTYKNVNRLSLYEKSFDFKNQANYVKHGPITIVSFDNVIVPEIPRECFVKSLASVTFLNSRIGSLHTEAFKSTEISAVVIINTTIGDIRQDAFTDRTLIHDFRISKCNISQLRNRSITAAITNFSLSHSIVSDIESHAVVSTVAHIEILGNQIVNFQPLGFTFNKWSRIVFDDNIIKYLGANFIDASASAEIEKFSFKGNEIYNAERGSLGFLSKVEEKFLNFDDNFFNQSCECSIEKWLEKVTNDSRKVKLVTNTSFCTINKFLSQCYSLPIGIINIQNFTEKTCNNTPICEPYEGKTRVVDTTSKIFLQEEDNVKQQWLIFIIAIVGIFIVAIVVTFVFLLIRGSRWLKEKGYFRSQPHYNNNDLSNEDEGTIVTMDENEKLEIPEELTLEFLQMLAVRLDDPTTNQEASEMIERLYEMFIVDDSYENNNRQDEEAHLYEELGNLNLQIPPPPYEEPKDQTSSPRGILKLMEEKFNLQTEDHTGPTLANDYSEPSDAAVHLYSELKNKNDRLERIENKDTIKSNGSAKHTFRPLPRKPANKSYLLDEEAGPSTKL